MRVAFVSGAVLLTACGGPPPSRVPSGQAAIDRMRASYGCESTLAVDTAKVDAFADGKRVRTDVMMLAAAPDRFRLDVQAPLAMGPALVVTSDGARMVVNDVRAGKREELAPSALALERWLGVPVPPAALVTLLLGHAPVLRHGEAPSLAWRDGAWHVLVSGGSGAREELTLEVDAADWSRPWSEQRLRPTRVRVEQNGVLSYDVELGATKSLVASTCSTAIPRALRFRSEQSDVLLQLDEVRVNPDLPAASFAQ